MSANSRQMLFLFAGAAVSAALLAYSYLPLTAPTRFISPDESSNHFFAAKFADSGSLYHFEPLNLIADGRVHPRSVRVVDDMLVPGGFLGLPVVFGSLAALIGKWAIPFLTPVFAVIAVCCWGLMVARGFGKRAGALAAFFLAAHPAWWYASARTLQPNVLFASLLIAATALLALAPISAAIRRRELKGMHLLRRADGALAGMLIGLAVAVRPSEAYLLAVMAIALLVVLRRSLPWERLLIAAIFALATFAPFLIMNQSLYGHPLATGYGTGVDVPVGEVPGGMGDRLLGPLRPWLFPLGFAPRTALAHFLTYGLGFFWWWSMLVVCAAVALGKTFTERRKVSAQVRAFLAAGIAALVWLVPFYGSWTIHDNPDMAAVTIGSSYLRYWLPLFVLSTLPVALLFDRAMDRARTARARTAFAAILCAGFFAASAADVFLSPQEGLAHVRANVVRSDMIAREVAGLTSPRALIIVDRADKFLWPDRAVMYPLRDEATYALLPKLSRFADLYYYGITFPEQDLRYLNEEKLPPLGLSVAPVRTFGQETLYHFTADTP